MSAALAIAQEALPHVTDPEIWLERHGDYLYSFAMFRLRDAVAAEDVLQETLLAALQSRKGFACLSTERTWLVGILKHKVMDYFRRAGRGRACASDEDEPVDCDAEFFDQAGAWKEGCRPVEWDADPVSL